LWELCPFELKISRNIFLKQLVSTTPLKLHMVALLPTKFHEILFSSFRGVALTNCVTDRTKTICLPTKVGWDIILIRGHSLYCKNLCKFLYSYPSILIDLECNQMKEDRNQSIYRVADKKKFLSDIGSCKKSLKIYLN
jgi:hypothetical protein